MLHPDYRIAIIDAIAENLTWEQFEEILRDMSPRYYLSHVTAPTLTNDMRGIMLARSSGARTIAFGTHVTPLAVNTMRDFPCLDFVLKGEPELTLRELIDLLEQQQSECSDRPTRLRDPAEPAGSPERCAAVEDNPRDPLSQVDGLVWRESGEIVVNRDRAFIPDLNALPLPLYGELPLDRYRMPLMKGPFAFVVTSRGCPAGCKFCIKHVTYQRSVRLLSPSRIFQEIEMLVGLGVRNIHMYADLFTVDRDQVLELCRLLVDSGLRIRWTCNSRVDFVDREMLEAMGRSGCWLISWGLESGNPEILRRAHKGTDPQRAIQTLTWARKAGIKNWGYFIIGLPGETEETIRQTIDFSKQLPLDIALFHIAAPYPGTPFFYEVVEKGWFRKGTRWEEVDMDEGTVLDYENLSAEQLMYWQRRAFREWALRPRPALTFLRMLLSDTRTFGQAFGVGKEHLSWVFSKKQRQGIDAGRKTSNSSQSGAVDRNSDPGPRAKSDVTSERMPR